MFKAKDHIRRVDRFDRDFDWFDRLFKVMFVVALLGVLASWVATGYVFIVAVDKAPAFIDAATKALDRVGDP